MIVAIPLNAQSELPASPRPDSVPDTATPINGDATLQALVSTAQQSDAHGDFVRAHAEWLNVAAHLERQFGSDSWQTINARLESDTALRQSQFTESQKQIAREIDHLEGEATRAAQAKQWQTVLEKMQSASDKTSELFGPHSHVVARIKAQMGQIAIANGNPQQAWELYRDALSSMRETMGIDHPETEALNDGLGNLLQNNGQTEMALPYRSKCVSICQRLYGETTAIYADRCAALGVVLYETGSPEEAVRHLSTAESILRGLQSADDPQYAKILVDLGTACLETKQYEQALHYLQTANELLKKELGGRHSMTMTAMTHLSTALVLNGHADQAETLLREVLAEQKTGTNQDPVASARTAYKLAVLLGRKGNFEESDRLLREAITVQQNNLGNSHADTQRSLSTLATLMDKAGRTEEAAQIRSYIEQIARQTAPEKETFDR